MNKARAFLDQIYNPDAEFPSRLRMYRQILLLFFGIYVSLLFILYIIITKALPVSENVTLIFAAAIIIIVKFSAIFFVVGYLSLFFLRYWMLWKLRKTGH